MIVAVTDACIFIDLLDLELINAFFNLDLEIHTSSTVLHEFHVSKQSEIN
jgi:hypothetical protein